MARKGKILGKAEFLNIQGISPLVSKVDIKILYTGENRNGYDISEETGIKLMSKIRCLPIVGHYLSDKNDFGGHDSEITQKGNNIVVNELTVPYGFVSENAKIWKQDFEELDEDENPIKRTYFMTEGYIWTGIYPESVRVLLGKNNQSMELQEGSISGEWAINPNSGMEFFILDDATLTKLCILGEDVEPCFEGADIIPSASFSLNDEEEDLMTKFMLAFSKHLKGVNKQMDKQKEKEDMTKEDTTNKNESKENNEEETKVESNNKKEDKEENTEKTETGKEEKKTEKSEEETKEDNKEEKEEDKKEKKFSLNEMSEILSNLTQTLSNFSSRLDKIEQNTKTEEEIKKEKENEKKEEMISKFSAMSVSEMAKALGETQEESEKETQDNLEQNITTFSVVNNGRLNNKEDKSIPEYVSYVQKFDK